MKKISLALAAIFAVFLVAYGAGTTVNGTRTINGNLTVKGTCTGCGAASSGFVLLSRQTPSGVASADFTSVITSTYTHYTCQLEMVIPATSPQELDLLVSSNNGMNWQSSGYYSGVTYGPNTGASGTLQVTNGGALQLFTAIDNTVGNAGLSGTIDIWNPQSTASRKSFTWQILGNQTGAVYTGSGSGVWNTSGTAVNAIQFKFGGGVNIASGTIACGGWAKS